MNHQTLERIAILSERGEYTTELRKVSFYGNPPKLDIRKWQGDQPLKGISLTDEEAERLAEALHGISKGNDPESQ